MHKFESVNILMRQIYKMIIKTTYNCNLNEV